MDDIPHIETSIALNDRRPMRNTFELTQRQQQESEKIERQKYNHQKTQQPTSIRFPSSLDFERVVNQYSIQSTHDRFVKITRPFEDDGSSIFDHETENLLLKETKQDQTYNSIVGSRRKTIMHQYPASISPLKTLRQQETGTKVVRWVLSILTGLLTGLVSILIVSCTDTVQSWRSHLLDRFWQKELVDVEFTYFMSPWQTVFLLYMLTNLSFALISACLCLYFAPEAVGSGIPEVKAYLNGVRVKRFTSIRLFSVKIFGTIASVSSGLAIGPEGPLVHIGAILGATCSKISNLILHMFPDNSLFLMNEDLWSFVTTELSHFSMDRERRDLVSIGAAAGFAAAFGAPIGGLLFSMEEASSYFDHSLLLRTLSATAVATFCLAVHHGNLSRYSIISLGTFETPNEDIFLNRVEEVPLYIVIAIVGGLLGGFFCWAWKRLQTFRKLNSKFVDTRSMIFWKLVEVVTLSVVTSFITYFLPLLPIFCRLAEHDDDLVNDDATNINRFHDHQFDCPPGHINELADIFFGSREDAISAILTSPEQFSIWTLAVVGGTFLPLMLVTLGVSLPSGIFMPTFLIGSSLGGAAGMLFQQWISPKLSPSTFALLGAAALLSGIQRSTVSLCVILVEGTGQVKVLIPVIITVVVSKYVADLVISHGFYEISIEINNYPFLEHKEVKSYDIFQVSQIMSTPPVTLSMYEQADTIVRILRETQHHGFPVVDRQTQKFLGLVRRDQLVALIECGVFHDNGDSLIFNDLIADENVLDSSIIGTPMSSEMVGSKPHEDHRLMNLAYHINDDRYDFAEFDMRGSISSSPISKQVVEKSEDEFDTYVWLHTLRRSLASMPSIDNKMRRPNSRTTLNFGDNSLPPLTPSTTNLQDIVDLANDSPVKGLNTREYATVSTSRKGNVFIDWLNPTHKSKWVNVGAVMNLGTYTVSEFCPVSKAHFLFTALGLRHLIVLGGESGGAVVGIVTRINLMKYFVEDRTGYSIQS